VLAEVAISVEDTMLSSSLCPKQPQKSRTLLSVLAKSDNEKFVFEDAKKLQEFFITG